MGWNFNWPVKKTGVLSGWLKSDTFKVLTEGIAENQAENGDSNPPPRSNPLHAPAEHVKAYKRLLVLVKSKENIDKTKFCFTEIGKRNVHTSLQLSIHTAVLTLQLQMNLKTRQPDIWNKRYCFITFCCAQTLPSYYFLKYILKSSPGFFYSDMLSNSVKLFFFNTFSPKLHPVLC